MNLPGKGLKNQNCNVTHCQSPEGVFFFNSGTQAYYCRSCCWGIMAACGSAGKEIFPYYNENNEEFQKWKQECRRKAL